MHRKLLFVLSFIAALAASSARLCLRAADYASAVVDYTPGTNAAAGYTDPASALGAPASFTAGPYGGAITPFDPAYLTNQLVGLGAGGSLTIQFMAPVQRDTNHPFGLDFLIFSGAGFVITNAFDTNYNYIGIPATDGSMFGTASGQTRVSVSADGTHFFTLDPALAPPVAGLFPTDGQGDFSLPVDPGLGDDAFAGETLAGIRRLYAGSGGGAGYSLGWARDSQGSPVSLSEAGYIRVEVLSGRAEIDAFAAVEVPSAPVLSIGQAGGGLVLSWPAWAVAYTLQSSPQLSPGTWEAVPGATGNTLTLTAADAGRFYRLAR